MKDVFRCLVFIIYLSLGVGFSVVTCKVSCQREAEKVAPGTGSTYIMCRNLKNLYIYTEPELWIREFLVPERELEVVTGKQSSR